MTDKEKTCRTCRHNLQDCALGIRHGCGEKHGFALWEPYTNADRIRKMSDDELADWIMRAGVDGAERLVCKDRGVGCWYDCKHKHFCESAYGRDVVINWLKGETDEPV